jgi:DNA replication protein DnaC
MEDLKKYLIQFDEKIIIEKLTEQSKINDYLVKTLCQMVHFRSGGQKEFKVVSGLESTYNQIFMYLNQNKDVCDLKNNITVQPWDLSKGLLLIGNFGRGKTLLLDMIYSQRRKLKISGKYITAFELSQSYFQDQKKFDELVSGESSLFLDEIGDEPKEITNYGNSENTTYRAMKLFFDKVEKQSEKSRFFGTSNLGQTELIQRYDERIWSRIVGNCNIIVFGGDLKDFRKG